MYIVLDTNIFTADKHFRHSFWRLIGTRPKRWGLHVAVPWPVVQEAIANRRRALKEALDNLNKALDGVARQGVPASALETIQALQREIDGYEDWFEDKLKGLRIDVLPADFDHSETVYRAVNRLPPCNTKGDGYRDTLNWLTVVRLVERSHDQDIVWVSNDSDFFVEPDPPRLHRNLIEDLAALGAVDRVSCRRDLAQAHELLIDKHQLDAETWGWSTLQERVAELVVAELDTSKRILDPVACGLPLYIKTAHALLESATQTDPATVTNLEADPTGEDRVLPFEVRFDAQCRMIQYSRADGEASVGLTDDGSQEIIPKLLLASGTIRIDGQDHDVTDVVIDEVTGIADDPAVLRNQSLVQQRAEWMRILDSSQLSGQDAVASLARVVGPPESLTKTLAAQFGEETIARLVGPPESLTKTLAAQFGAETVARLVGPPESLTKMFGGQLGAETFAASVARLVGPPESLTKTLAAQFGAETVARLVGPPESLTKMFGGQNLAAALANSMDSQSAFGIFGEQMRTQQAAVPDARSRGSKKRSRGKRKRKIEESRASIDKRSKGK